MAMYHRNNYERNGGRRSEKQNGGVDNRAGRVVKRGGMSIGGAVLGAVAVMVCAVLVLTLFCMSANPVPAILPVLLIVAIGGAIGNMCDQMGW